MIKELISGGISAITGGIRDVVSQFKLAPEDQLKFEAQLRDIERSETEATIKAAESVLVAEAQSQDGYVRRARPTFLYLVYLLLLYNYVARPVMGQPPVELPEELIFLFGAGILGYQGARSWEKVRGKAT